MPQSDAALAVALAAGMSQQAAAEAVGVSRATVTRRLRDPAFEARVEELRAAHARRLAERLGALGDRACDALEHVLARGEGEGARVSAARTVLTSALAFAEAGDLEARIAALEARAASTNGHRAGAAW